LDGEPYTVRGRDILYLGGTGIHRDDQHPDNRGSGKHWIGSIYQSADDRYGWHCTVSGWHGLAFGDCCTGWAIDIIHDRADRLDGGHG
jgi:hypothetical protein